MNQSNILEYRRQDALAYAWQWGLSSNPRFYDFSELGGDCTNFASQVLWAGGASMNYDPNLGWYYIDANRKSPSWTGVNFLFDFLTANRGPGPFAKQVEPGELQIGDLIQLSFQGGGRFNHSMVVTKLEPPFNPDHIYVTIHTPNRVNIRATTYPWREIRFIHILGCRS